MASPRIASAFQLPSTLSSRPGHTRLLRIASSFARAASTCFSTSAGSSCSSFAICSNGHEHVRVPRAFEVRLLVESETAAEHAPLERRQRGAHFGARPHVELAFVSFGVGVVGGIEATARSIEASCISRSIHSPVSRRDALEQRIAGGQRRFRVRREQRAVVVQHLLEVRNHPELVDRVTREAAAQLVVHAAFGHARERERGHVQRVQVRLLRDRGRMPVTHQPVDGAGMRKLRRVAEAAIALVEGGVELLARAVERRRA